MSRATSGRHYQVRGLATRQRAKQRNPLSTKGKTGFKVTIHCFECSPSECAIARPNPALLCLSCVVVPDYVSKDVKCNKGHVLKAYKGGRNE